MIYGRENLSDSRIRFATVLVFISVAAPLWGHQAEPISTEFALPFEPGVGNFKIGYAYERVRPGASEQSIPELELELGVVPRWQVNIGLPVLRVREGPGEPAEVGGGKLELGTRFLLLGGKTRSYAVSFQGTVDAPTGRRRLVGNAVGLGGGLFFDRTLSDRLIVHSNLTWARTVGGQGERERAFEYNNAVVWFATYHWTPVFEVLGKTDTTSGRTELAAQPEIIYHAGRHVELKAGLPVGMTSASARIGVRGQIAFVWGGAQ